MMTEEEIILIKKSVKITDYSKPWAETIAFAHAIIEFTQNRNLNIINSKEKESDYEKR